MKGKRVIKMSEKEKKSLEEKNLNQIFGGTEEYPKSKETPDEVRRDNIALYLYGKKYSELSEEEQKKVRLVEEGVNFPVPLYGCPPPLEVRDINKE